MTARCVMVWGTSSGAGTGWLATALCRWFARQGLRVAPFKAQDIGDGTRAVATPDGGLGEIGSGPYLQALAARAAPDVRMNPVLLKPGPAGRSQVVLLGQADAKLSALPEHERGVLLWPVVRDALDGLRAGHDVVVIEGAGPPAEIHLQDGDIANLRVATHAQARCLLVADAGRGGAFAHLYGTWALLPGAERALLHGFVLDRVGGDAALLDAGVRGLERRTGVPTLAMLPRVAQDALPVRCTIAIVAGPRGSNLGEFEPLASVPGVAVRRARTPAELAGADWVILPGSAQTAADLQWLRRQGLAGAVVAHANAGGRVLGIGGGLQMLGEALVDPADIAGNGPGLGLLPLVTQFAGRRTVRRTGVRFEALAGPWSALSGLAVEGDQSDGALTAQHAGMAAGRIALPGGRGWQNEAGNVLGVTLHGLFEDAGVLRALFGAGAPTLDGVFEGRADAIERAFVAGALPGLIAC